MLLGLAIFAGCLLAVFGVIALHECGHFLLGIAAGIPAREMKIRLLTFPQHVALREGDGWLDPTRDYHLYVVRAQALAPDRSRQVAYAAGGLVVQTVVVVLFVFAWRSLGGGRLWLVPLTLALVSVPLLYLCADLIFTRLARRPCGDFSVLWAICPAASIAVSSFVLIIHLLVLFHVWVSR